MSAKNLSPEEAECYQELEDEKLEAIVSIRQILLSVPEAPNRIGNFGNIREVLQNPLEDLGSLLSVLTDNFRQPDWNRLASLNPADGKKCGLCFHNYILTADRQRRLLGKPWIPWYLVDPEEGNERRIS